MMKEEEKMYIKKCCTVHVQVHVVTHTLQMYGIVHCTVVPTI